MISFDWNEGLRPSLIEFGLVEFAGSGVPVKFGSDRDHKSIFSNGQWSGRLKSKVAIVQPVLAGCGWLLTGFDQISSLRVKCCRIDFLLQD